jgi:nitrogen fixation NifU-like protein
MGLLEDMYKAVILEHSQHPRNRGPLPEATVSVEANNPSCGDEVRLHVLVRNGLVEGIAFEGAGCAISQASASLMTQAVKGKSVVEGLAVAAAFHRML